MSPRGRYELVVVRREELMVEASAEHRFLWRARPSVRRLMRRIEQLGNLIDDVLLPEMMASESVYPRRYGIDTVPESAIGICPNCWDPAACGRLGCAAKPRRS